MTTAEDVSFHGETATLVVSQARSPIALGCAENTVLLEQVVNDRLLTSINPAREQQEKEGERGRELVHAPQLARGVAGIQGLQDRVRLWQFPEIRLGRIFARHGSGGRALSH